VSTTAELLAEVAAVLQARDGIRLAYVFGSRGRDEASPDSDLDVAVLADEPMSAVALGDLVERLEAETGIHRVDLVDLAVAAPLVCDEVARDGILVHGTPEDRLAFELRTFHRVEDTRPLREAQQRLIREAARHGRSA
jgi:predicted nucleotidyltransferase